MNANKKDTDEPGQDKSSDSDQAAKQAPKKTPSKDADKSEPAAKAGDSKAGDDKAVDSKPEDKAGDKATAKSEKQSKGQKEQGEDKATTEDKSAPASDSAAKDASPESGDDNKQDQADADAKGTPTEVREGGPHSSRDSSSERRDGAQKHRNSRGQSDSNRPLSYMARRDATELADLQEKKREQNEKDIAGKRKFSEAIAELKPKDILYATGRRKTSSARVYMKLGTGKITVNNRTPEDYFARKKLLVLMKQPLVKMGAETMFDLTIQVRGSGISGQAGAVRHGIARILAEYDTEKNLRRAGMVTRDPRSVERKKIGFHKARKRPQYSKR